MEMVDYAQFKKRIEPTVAALTAERASEPGSSEGVHGSRTSSSPAEGAGTTLTDEDHGILTALSTEAKQKRDADVQGEKLASFTATWRSYAKRRVDVMVSLFSEPQTESQLKQLISQTDLANSEGVPKSHYVACVFTCGLSSEAITDPYERGAPFKKGQAQQAHECVCGRAEAFAPEGGVRRKATVHCWGPGRCCFDNQKRGLHQSFMKCAKGEAGSKTAVKAVNIVRL